ncbi:hypothetical protein [Micromonospora rosaria]|uniref:hypothetical protein n=1 Tax=Micromonospora rosaria TaxID=47874 RepID=UPI000B238085|nr:hypothetical protein [Micromonospora rosaria]
MFSNDSEFMLALHRTHAAELQVEAAQERLARALPRRRSRGWLGRRRRPVRTDDVRR